MFLVLSCFVFANSIEAGCEVENEDVAGGAPTGVAPTTSEWSMICYQPCRQQNSRGGGDNVIILNEGAVESHFNGTDECLELIKLP